MRADGRLIAVLPLLSLLLVATPATAQLLAHQDDPTPITAEALRASLGRKIGQPGFNPLADLNGDGVVNAHDVALFKLAQREGRSPSRTTAAARTVAGTARIIVEPAITTALPGQTVSVWFLLRGNTTPLSGYSVDVDTVADPDAVGVITANVGLTNFFDQQNLITACPPAICPTGAIRDPLFSVISDNGTGGVSVTTSTDDFSTVQAVDDVNDVLAQVLFDIPVDAVGDFTIQLGSSSTLIDGTGAAVSFTATAGTIHVLDPSIPTVSQWGMVVMSVSIMAAGCVVCAGAPNRSSGLAVDTRMENGDNDRSQA